MQIFSQDLLTSLLSTHTGELVKFEIFPDPVDSTVTLVATGYTQIGNSIEVPVGTQVTYTVSKATYTTEGPKTITIIGETNKNIKLSQKSQYNFTVVPVPDYATVSINGLSGVTTAKIYEGDDASYGVSAPGMTSKTGVVENIRESTSIDVVLTANLTVRPVKTVDGVTVDDNDAIVTWYTSRQETDGSHEKTITLPVNTTATYKVEKTGYIDFPGSFPASGATYLTNAVATVELQKKTLTFSVVASPADALIEINVNGTPAQSGTGSVTVPCYIDDVITWRVSRNNYTARTGTYTMTDVSHTETVSLSVSAYFVYISVTPSFAMLTLKDSRGTTLITGTGSISYDVSAGEEISCTAQAGEVTQTNDYTVNSDISDTITLDPQAGGMLVYTESQDVTMPPGRYNYILVGGGGPGTLGGQSNYQSVATTAGTKHFGFGGNGGAGGGSGYIVTNTFLLTQSSVVGLSVGAGGVSSDGESTSLSIDGATIATANGGKVFVRVSGVTITPDGGSGGGGSAPGGSWNVTAGNRDSADGNSGGLGGGNGQDSVNSLYGVGFYNTVKSYANNGGTKGTIGTGFVYATAGKGGVGLSSISSSLYTMLKASVPNLQTLYNAIAGGGGGGSDAAPHAMPVGGAYHWGGPGGGGGGWFNGEDGVEGETSSGTAGKGGDGAVIIARVSWE